MRTSRAPGTGSGLPTSSARSLSTRKKNSCPARATMVVARPPMLTVGKRPKFSPSMTSNSPGPATPSDSAFHPPFCGKRTAPASRMRLTDGGPNVVDTSRASTTSGKPALAQPARAAAHPAESNIAIACIRIVSPTYIAIRKSSLTQLLASCYLLLMRVYFVGSHATGNTTMTRYVSRRYGLPMITEVARAVLAELETSLDALRTDVDLVAEYQRRVFERQVQVEKMQGSGFVSDRAFDNLAYAAEHTLIFADLINSPTYREYME